MHLPPVNHDGHLPIATRKQAIAVLFNPSSGKGRSAGQRTAIEACLNSHGIGYDWYVSESAEHLGKLAAETAGTHDILVGVGGDTTFTIVAEEILKRTSATPNHNHIPALAMIGTGSANDVTRGLGFTNLNDACLALKNPITAKMDVGLLEINDQIHSRHFLGTLSLGLGTIVNRYIEQFQHQHPRLVKIKPLYHVVPGILAINDAFREKKVPLRGRLEYTDMATQKEIVLPVEFSLLVFLNTPFYADGLKLCPDASLFDGVLDCCLLRTTSFYNTLRVGLKTRKGQMELDQKTIRRAPAFKFFPDNPVDIQVDGDIMAMVTNLEVSILPGSLDVVIKKGAAPLKCR